MKKEDRMNGMDIDTNALAALAQWIKTPPR
jgi:hypothetical protein